MRGKKAGTVFYGEKFDFVNGNGGDEFVRVAPYCDAPQRNADGEQCVQRFDLESGLAIVERFKDRSRRLLSRLGFAKSFVPFFNGHPDFANDDAERDTTVYAEATDLEARADGLYAKIKRTDLLDALKNALGKLEISPRWLCRKDEASGTFKPFELLSFGLVKKGNLAGADFINSKTLQGEEIEMFTEEQKIKIAEMLGVPVEELTAEAIIAALDIAAQAKAQESTQESTQEEDGEAVNEDEEAAEKEEADVPAEDADKKEEAQDVPAEINGKDVPAEKDGKEDLKAEEKQDVPAGEEEKPAEAEAKDEAKDEDEKKKKELDAANAELANTRHELAQILIEKAVAEGKIVPAKRDEMLAKFDSDFVNARAELDAINGKAVEFSNEAETVLNEAAQSAADSKNAKEKFSELVNTRLSVGDNYAQAVSNVFNSKEGRELYSHILNGAN